MVWKRTSGDFSTWLYILCLGAAFLAPAAAQLEEADLDSVAIRRTTDGIPHIRAGSWYGLGYGFGYVQAQDALCTLAEAFITFQGRRSYFFGPEARPHADSTFGRPRNLELDVFFRAFADAATISEYRRQQPEELNALIEGFAAGYNFAVGEIRASAPPEAGHPCAREDWVREITAEDIFRRMVAANLAAGYAKFIPEIVNAAPEAATPEKAEAAVLSLRRRLAHILGKHSGLGSNAIAFGQQATGEAGAVLFGNPHWYWHGPDRFYQAHLILPGRLNVAGVSLLGIPIIMIGFNDSIAWTHTVSEAQRFGLFELTLDAADPTHYFYAGRRQAMEPARVAVEVRGKDGNTTHITRTLYRSRFGPVVDFSAYARPFGWTPKRAFAIRDINAANFRVFRTFFYWNQASSLDEFVAIQRREAGLPWVNTLAIGRGDGRVWFADLGAVPNVPDSLRSACTTERGRAFASIDAQVPVLDGRRAECDWRVDRRAVQPGAMPADRQPALFRKDYVASMNGSYWLANPRQPLLGYPKIFGGEGGALSLRSRLGHGIAQELLASAPLPAVELSRRLRREVVDARAYSAELFKAQVLEQVCPLGTLEVTYDVLTERAFTPARRIDLTPACQVLRAWSNKGNAQDRGAHLWDAFWARVTHLSSPELFRTPFSPDSPLDTPRDLKGDDPRVAQALGAAILEITENGLALDAPRGSYLYLGSGAQRAALYGGCHYVGYFMVTCGEDGQEGSDNELFGNTYMQVVSFGADGVEAYTLLAHGQEEFGLAGRHRNDALHRYAAKSWLRFPFTETQIQRDAELKRIVLRWSAMSNVQSQR